MLLQFRSWPVQFWRHDTPLDVEASSLFYHSDVHSCIASSVGELHSGIIEPFGRAAVEEQPGAACEQLERVSNKGRGGIVRGRD